MRKRTIKPDFFSDPKTGRLSPTSQSLFIGMWCLSDREGYIENDVDFIKVQVLPYLKSNIKSNLEELIEKELVIRCNYMGKELLNIVNFVKHQPIHPHEAKSPYPSIDSDDVIKCNYKGLHPNSNSKGKSKSKDISKKEYGEFLNVLLSEEEYNKCLSNYQTLKNLEKAIDKLSGYIESSGKGYKSHYAVLGKSQWVYKEIMKIDGNAPVMTNREKQMQAILERRKNR